MVYSKWLLAEERSSAFFSFREPKTWNLFDCAQNRLEDLRLVAFFLISNLNEWKIEKKNSGKKSRNLFDRKVEEAATSIRILSVYRFRLHRSLSRADRSSTREGKQIYNTKKTKHELEKGETTATIWYLEWESDKTKQTNALHHQTLKSQTYSIIYLTLRHFCLSSSLAVCVPLSLLLSLALSHSQFTSYTELTLRWVLSVGRLF